MFAKLKLPHAITLIFALIGCMAIATHLVPAGVFDHSIVDGRDTVVAGTYHLVTKTPQGLWAALQAPFRGLVEAADVVFFVLLVGSAFGVIEKTGAVTTLLNAAARKLADKGAVLIPASMLFFAIGGTMYGMCEETLPFYLLYIPLLTALGYDTLTGMAVVFVGAGVGVAASTLNPFATGIAQALAGLAPGSGLRERLLAWIAMTAIAILYVMRHAARVKSQTAAVQNREASPVFRDDIVATKRHVAVIAAFFIGMAALVFGITRWQWYVPEIATIFVTIALAAALLGGLSEHDTAAAFVSGASNLTATALMIGMARGILVIARDGHIIDTALNAMANVLTGFPGHLLLTGMLVAQSFIAFIVPSSSAHAALTMPLMAPLGDLTGISRQHVVTAFQFASGFTNLITPTSGLLMGALALAKIPWSRWLRFMLPLLALLFVTGVVFLLLINNSGVISPV